MSDPGWVELWVEAVDGEVAESLAEAWRRIRPTGVVVEERGPPDEVRRGAEEERRYAVRLFLEGGPRGEEGLRRAEEAAGWLRRIRPFGPAQRRPVVEQDWEAVFRSSHGRIEVGRRLLVLPPWDRDPVPEGRVAVRIEPGSAFGVGSHPTTRLALSLLEDAVRPGQRVADLGCGSGVLGIAAARLGAAEVWCGDVDPAAVEATREAARENGVDDRLRVQQGSVESLPPGFADLLVMNIVAEVLVTLLPEAVRRLRPGSTLILSGILGEKAAGEGAAGEGDMGEKEEAVRAAAPGLCVEERRQEGEWVGLRGRIAASETDPPAPPSDPQPPRHG